jgi:hypothetical protein
VNLHTQWYVFSSTEKHGQIQCTRPQLYSTDDQYFLQGCEVDDYLLIGEIHLLQDLLYTQ